MDRLTAHPTPESIRALMARCGLAPAVGRDLAEARALAARLISAEIAPLETVAEVQRASGESAVFLKREQDQATGVIAFFGLSAIGEQALLADRFDARRVDPSWIARPSAALRAGFVWCVAGETRAGRRALCRAVRMLNEAVAPRLRLYARAASGDGRRLLQASGFTPAGPDRTALFRCDPHEAAARLEAAS